MPTSTERPEKKSAIGHLDEEMKDLIRLNHEGETASSLTAIATGLDNLASAIALRVLAEHGSAEDRLRAVERLKQWLDAPREEK